MKSANGLLPGISSFNAAFDSQPSMPNGRAVVTGAGTKYYGSNGDSSSKARVTTAEHEENDDEEDDDDEERASSINDCQISPEDAEALLWDAQVGSSRLSPEANLPACQGRRNAFLIAKN